MQSNPETMQQGTVTTIVKLNVRKGLPATNAPISAKLAPGVTLAVYGTTIGESIRGNPVWFRGEDQTFIWSGGTSSASPATDLDDEREPSEDNAFTIRPLAEGSIRRLFGEFRYSEVPGGRIRIIEPWERENIVEFQSPELAHCGILRLPVHKYAVKYFQLAFDRICALGIDDSIISCSGTYMPRHKGWDPSRGLSSHSWGIAIDINAQWNGYGSEPAPLNAIGSVRKLVPCFAEAGFAWGGHFTQRYRDGMHFELAKLDV